ncbi:hypothetical protein [Streptomyces sp. NPDC058157]|uniref:hypothetical protein n=1 Tax=Streptomyces sp. NPDC058157 TaxID=3346360 RepID=UPI0036E04D0D
MNSRSLGCSPQEFFARLADDKLGLPLFLTGMIKLVDDASGGHALFSLGTDCAHWRRIPLDIIDSIEFLRFLPCAGRTQPDEPSLPLVRLMLKAPVTEEAATYASLTADVQREAQRVISAAQRTAQAPGASLDKGGGGGGDGCGACIRFCETQDPDYFWECIKYCMRTVCSG